MHVHGYQRLCPFFDKLQADIMPKCRSDKHIGVERSIATIGHQSVHERAKLADKIAGKPQRIVCRPRFVDQIKVHQFADIAANRRERCRSR